MSTPSPSFLKSVFNIVSFFVFPILSVIWIVNCLRAGKSEWLGFLVFGAIGIACIFGIACYPDITIGLSLRTWSLLVYCAAFFLHLVFLGAVKDEMTKSAV